jgi:hypothetical protein
MSALLQPGIPTYIHNQESPDILWVINHDLNQASSICEVLVDIDGTLEVAIPANITYTSNNQILIDWSHPHIGRARIV